jgi:glycosyltransferase involved in cell wall biosynthesis
MSADQANLYYAVNALGAGASFHDERLQACTDRHRIQLTPPALQSSSSLLGDAMAAGARGLVIEVVYGWANRQHLQLARAALRSGLRVWFYWPREQAVEFIDRERCSSHWRLWAYVKSVAFVYQMRQKIHRFAATHAPQRIRPYLKAALNRAKQFQARLLSSSATQAEVAAKTDINERLAAEYEQMIDRLISKAAPVPFAFGSQEPSVASPVDGLGAYLRTDYWAPINTGGSYGHTCYVAKELAATTRDFACFMANRFVLLDEMKLAQRVMVAPSPTCDEMSLIRANGPYYEFLARQMAESKVAYIYERICLGNFIGARLSQELGIPYIVEYNGSEISMRRSFDTGDFEHERFFLKAEEAAFKQATIISVISDAVRDDLQRRGIPADKILVNPNGVDLEAYAPMEVNMRALLRRELGFKPSDRVIGFIGTFGGWHGIDVLAEAIPQICRRDENVKFLLIGDGNFKHLIDDAIKRHDLANRVTCTGRVPHQRGAQLLGACDIYASPHSSHMVDSRFFGSPTKLFEYMAMGGGIVGSDLEQIGEVLSPALHATNLTDSFLTTHERSVLCTPGSVGEFVEAVIFLARHSDIAAALGRNARQAAEKDFSWQNHVARLWSFAASGNTAPLPQTSRLHATDMP